MRFRPANISLINRRHYMPRLLLILSLKYKHKNHPTDLQLLTGHTISTSGSPKTRPKRVNATSTARGNMGRTRMMMQGSPIYTSFTMDFW